MNSCWNTIYDDAKNICEEAKRNSPLKLHQINDILNSRGPEGLLPEATAAILNTIINVADNQDIISTLINAASNLRKLLFGSTAYIMAPIEVSNICSSDCAFCGWRSSNGDMKRIRISKETFLAQAQYLIDLGIKHIEIVGGDDVYLVREMLPELISDIKRLAYKVSNRFAVSICTMALTERQYHTLANIGLDAVLTWQETYNPSEYAMLIGKGPKAYAIDEHYHLNKDSNGYLNRLKSQARAAKAGLQVGLGAMLGLSSEMEVDIMATILHSRMLIDKGYTQKPIIIGMPTLNTLVSQYKKTPLNKSGVTPSIWTVRGQKLECQTGSLVSKQGVSQPRPYLRKLNIGHSAKPV